MHLAAMSTRITQAFNPIIDLVQALAYPLAFVAVSMGICLIIIGQKRQGLQVCKAAVVGYVLMQWLPGLMQILQEVGRAMRVQ